MENYKQEQLDMLAQGIAEISLSINAIKLNPEEPFPWASGYFMPIYNDNRLLLKDFHYRDRVRRAFAAILDIYGLFRGGAIIAGTSTAGISPATSLADFLQAPLIYVRDKPKDHGLKNQIEGVADDKDLGGRRVILIEDLVSTGGSSCKAVQAIRNAKGNIDSCIAIFSYEFDVAKGMFRGDVPFDTEGHKLQKPCNLYPLLTYSKLLACKENGIY